MDALARSALEPWLDERAKLPVGPLFCVIVGPTRGHRWSESAARLELRRAAIDAGCADASRLISRGMLMLSSCCMKASPPPLIQRQLGHTHLSTTGTYLQGVSSEEIISSVANV
jgi:integrase/recombinase XerD